MEREYWAYDITTISSYSECLKQVQYGHGKDGDGLPILKLALVFGEEWKLPFYYRKLAGNIPDLTTVKTLLADLEVLGFKKVKFVMDRGFYKRTMIKVRMIQVFDSKDYQSEWRRYKRDSVRAIIFSDNKLALIRSKKFGEYKFPGGGIEEGESHLDTLIRETMEETGLNIIPASVKEYGKTLIIRKGLNENEIFEQESFYYLCVVSDVVSPVQLDIGYETDYGYHLVFVSMETAIKANKKLLNISDIPWVERDLTVLLEWKDSFR